MTMQRHIRGRLARQNTKTLRAEDLLAARRGAGGAQRKNALAERAKLSAAAGDVPAAPGCGPKPPPRLGSDGGREAGPAPGTGVAAAGGGLAAVAAGGGLAAVRARASGGGGTESLRAFGRG